MLSCLLSNYSVDHLRLQPKYTQGHVHVQCIYLRWRQPALMFYANTYLFIPSEDLEDLSPRFFFTSYILYTISKGGKTGF